MIWCPAAWATSSFSPCSPSTQWPYTSSGGPSPPFPLPQVWGRGQSSEQWTVGSGQELGLLPTAHCPLVTGAIRALGRERPAEHSTRPVGGPASSARPARGARHASYPRWPPSSPARSEEHTSELQSRG